MSSHLYSTRHWKLIRGRQLALEPLCAYCRELGHVEPATVVDHIEPHRGDPALFYDVSNLQSLCKACHDGAKQQQEKSGYLRGSNVQGLPLDTNHHWRAEMDSEPTRGLPPDASHPWFRFSDE